MFRIYIAPQIGTGTKQDPIRSIINNFIDIRNGEWFDEYDFPARKYSMIFVFASQATHTLIGNDSQVVIMSGQYENKSELKTGLNVLVGDLPPAMKSNVLAKLEAGGVNAGWISNSNTLKQVIRYILLHFTLSQFTIKDQDLVDFLKEHLDTTVAHVPLAARIKIKNWMEGRNLDIGWITNQTTTREILHFIINNLGFGVLRFKTIDLEF